MADVMVVDDEKSILDVVCLILEKNGITCTAAKSADDCLKKLKTEKPNLILLDIMMPGRPSSDVVKYADKKKGAKSIKIIYLSAMSVSHEERALKLKGNNVIDFIQKPFKNDDLVKRIKGALKK
jgi:DNA-binding response OmpR family regulator